MATEDDYKKAKLLVAAYESSLAEKITPKLRCLCCKKNEVKPLGEGRAITLTHDKPLKNMMWDGGTVELISFGYGSRYDMNAYYIAICDDCIEAALESSDPPLSYKKLNKQISDILKS